MEVEVRAIEPTARDAAAPLATFQVVIAIDGAEHAFEHQVEGVQLGDQAAHLITGSAALTDLLHGQVEIDAAIRTLVARRYHGRRVRLPVVVGRITAPPIVRQRPAQAPMDQT